MSEPQKEYRIQPLQRIAKVYRFPEPSREEREKLQQERQEIADQKAMDALRRQAGLPEKYPPPWYKRIARFYDENWEAIFEGTGPAICFLVLLSSLALVFVAIGRATGWWGGAW